MFYAPWCGHCKAAKPQFEAAATELKRQKSKAIIAGIDVAGSAGRASGYKYNISGYPTIKYFENGVFKFDYQGGRTKDAIVEFIKKPVAAPATPATPPEDEWSNQPSEVVHLTEENFATHIAANPSVLVMFYAPWCGHCKAAKPEYMSAAQKMKDEEIPGTLAAVDATKWATLGKMYKVEGYPTIIYFKDGKEAFKYTAGRKEKDFVDFMRNPVEPPPPPPPEKKWSEEPSRVEHLTDDSFHKFLKRNRNKHTLVMFYAPWCGHCKAFKPDYTLAADSLKGTNFVLAAVDATEHKKVSDEFEIKGFPTIKYFHQGKYIEEYSGARTKQGLLDYFNSKVSDEF
jgi:protein disulfide-isomerase-like protein